MVAGYFSFSEWPNHGLLVHGGLQSPSARQPQSDLRLLSVKTQFKEPTVLDQRGPALSHHASCLVKNVDKEDVLILIGGWNGHSRTSKVYAYHLVKKVWINLAENPQGPHRVDPPIGLSGHTVTKIHSGLVVVIGREGGIKTQRKFGQMFLLHLNLKDRLYWYTESPLMPASRSGHTASLAPPRPPSGNTCDFLVFGGRDIDHVFKCGKWTTELVEDIPQSFPRVLENIGKLPQKVFPRMMGLRYHAMLVLAPDCLLIHGGRHFKAMNGKDVNGQFFLGRLENDDQENWCKLQPSFVAPRFGHALMLHKKCIYIIGGFKSDADQNTAEVEKFPISDDDAEQCRRR